MNAVDAASVLVLVSPVLSRKFLFEYRKNVENGVNQISAASNAAHSVANVVNRDHNCARLYGKSRTYTSKQRDDVLTAMNEVVIPIHCK